MTTTIGHCNRCNVRRYMTNVETVTQHNRTIAKGFCMFCGDKVFRVLLPTQIKH